VTLVEMRPARAIGHDLRGETRWPALDGVRGLAVVVVVAWHVFAMIAPSAGIGRSNVPGIWWPMGTARFGVDAFFVLSGFLVVRSWRTTRARTTTLAALREFGRRRILRIVPAYWVSLLVLVPLSAPALLTEPKHLALLGTVNGYVLPDLPGRVDTVYWSLTTEWHFYLLVPLVALVMVKVGKWPALAACVGLSVWWWHLPHHPFGLPASFVFGRLDQFVAGAVAATLVDAVQRGHGSALARALRRRGVGTFVIVAVLGLGMYHGSTFGRMRGNWFDPFVHPIVGLLVAVGLVGLCTRTRGEANLFSSRTLRLAGLLSYSLYLWHYPILEHGLRWFGVVTPIGAMDVLIVALLLALSAAAAVLAYVLVERPFLLRKTRSRAPTPDEARTTMSAPDPQISAVA
jgi:peptidoglycan/LPS O-acetylase OafA/YrhL